MKQNQKKSSFHGLAFDWPPLAMQTKCELPRKMIGTNHVSCLPLGDPITALYTKSQLSILLAKVNDIATKLGVNKLARADISALHRMAPKPGKARGVMVRFVHQDLRHTWLD